MLYVPERDHLHELSPPGDVTFPVEERALRGIVAPIPGESQLVIDALEFVDDRQRTIDAMNELTDRWWPAHWLL